MAPQAARLRVRAAASTAERNFFMINSPFLLFCPVCGPASRRLARRRMPGRKTGPSTRHQHIRTPGCLHFGLNFIAHPSFQANKKSGTPARRSALGLPYGAQKRTGQASAGCRSILHMHIIMPSRRSKIVFMTALPFRIAFLVCYGDSIAFFALDVKRFAKNCNFLQTL